MFDRQFSRNINRVNSPAIEVIYTNSNSLITKIRLAKYDIDSSIINIFPYHLYLRFSADKEDTIALCAKLANEYKLFHREHCEVKFGCESGRESDFAMSFNLRYENIQHIKRIIDSLYAKNIINEIDKNNLYNDFEFPVSEDEVNFYLLKQAEFDLAKAKEAALDFYHYNYKNVFFNLAENLQQKQNYQAAAEVYLSIPPDNEKYKEARLALRDLLIQKHYAFDSQKLSLDIEDFHTDLEKQFQFSLEGGDTVFATRIFSQLCGEGIQKEDIQMEGTTLIKLNDPQVFILLANKIAALNKKVARLEKLELQQETKTNNIYLYKRKKLFHSLWKSQENNNNNNVLNEVNNNNNAELSLKSISK